MNRQVALCIVLALTYPAALQADIYETTDAYVVILDMPGSAKNSISLTVDGDLLVVKSALMDLKGLPARGYYRTFNLGDGIDRNSIDARFEHSALSLKLFKKESVKPREITIR